ncbi:rRNA-binding ribosome biosynthesis protein [Sorochytrium milnesiophthora]
MARRRKSKKLPQPDESTLVPPPRSFVIKSGEVGKTVSRLVYDVRKIMEPNTAVKLRERSNNKLRDFVALAGPLHVSHMMVFTSSETGTNLRIGRLPHGPTLCFRVLNYSLMCDVAAAQKAPKAQNGPAFQHSPLLVLNNFNSEQRQVKLLATMLQSMFPTIDVQTMQISKTRRVVLFNYNSETETVDVRHYVIDVRAAGVSGSIKSIVSGDLPNLHDMTDISEYMARQSAAAESDAEDAMASTVVLPQQYAGRNNRANTQRAIKLTELGPRMELSLVKIQEGLCAGEVLYHRFVKKTAAELEEQRKRVRDKEAQKAQRRQDQEANVERKRQLKEAQKGDHAASDQHAEDDNREHYDALDEDADYDIGSDADNGAQSAEEDEDHATQQPPAKRPRTRTKSKRS